MKFLSTNKTTTPVSFKEAVIKSLPEDKGLYFPSEIPKLDSNFLSAITEKSLVDIAFEVLRPFCGEDVPEAKLLDILNDTFVFDIPLKEVEQDVYALELFHGPTMAFKDVGARFLARTLSYFQESEDRETTILVATSGDTGGAVASGFHHQPGINVVILYPSGKVSALQEQQMTTLGGNIRALEIDGNFDDCQALVKQAFLDAELNKQIKLSSANSINIARWLPQSIYYYLPFQQWGMDAKVTFSIPSGNYGNITSGILTKQMGLPIQHFIAASNANDVIPRFLQSGMYDPKDTIQTISNAMDVSQPSNFSRLNALYPNGIEAILKDLSGFSLNDDATLETIKQCLSMNDYLLDPHSAIGYRALREHDRADTKGIFLGTAHYCKFLPVIEQVLESEPPLPPQAEGLFAKEKQAQSIQADYASLKSFLLD